MSLVSYLIDYDLPSDNRRHGFYRRVSDYRKKFDLENEPKSTNSVIYTRDRAYAWFVYDTAIDCGGTAHVYAAKRLD